MIREERFKRIENLDAKLHMFTQERIQEYDYEDIITNKEHDVNVYGRYTEIEKLG